VTEQSLLIVLLFLKLFICSYERNSTTLRGHVQYDCFGSETIVLVKLRKDLGIQMHIELPVPGGATFCTFTWINAGNMTARLT
jgi:hypothetical protein